MSVSANTIDLPHRHATRLHIAAVFFCAFVALVAAVISVRFVFYDLFTHFRPWDDEGYMMLASKLMLDGHAIYDTVVTPYGPFHFLFHWIIHRVLGVPITNDAVRIVTLCHWILLSATCGWIVWQVTRSFFWTVAGYLIICLHMQAFTNEPGHTQEICGQLGAMLPVAVYAFGRRDRLKWAIIGLLCGLTLMSKVNIGLFSIAASIGLWWSDLKHRPRVLNLLCVLGSAAFPFVLMRPHLDALLCLYYAEFVSIALMATTIAVLRPTDAATPQNWRRLLWMFAGLFAAIAVSFAFVISRGSSIGGFVNAVEFYVQGQAYFTIFMWLPPALLVPTMAAVLVALVARSNKRFVPWMLWVGQISFAVAAVHMAINPSLDFSFFAAAPWAWLCLFPGCEHGGVNPRAPIATLPVRKMVALLSAWYLPIAYPVAGSQVQFATFFVIVSAIICACDAVNTAASFLRRFPAFQSKLVGGCGLAICTLVLSRMTAAGNDFAHDYASRASTGLRGMQWLHLPPEQAAEYRQLVEACKGADQIFVTSGLNSLFFWTERSPAVPVLISHDFRSVPPQKRVELIRALDNARRPFIAYEETSFDQLPPTELTDWLLTHFKADRAFGNFVILRRKTDQVTNHRAAATAP